MEKAKNKKILVYISQEILEELKRVLNEDFDEPLDSVQMQIDFVMRFTKLVESSEKLQIIKEDADDNKILECAVACKADFIVTGDNHLLKLREFRKIRIVSPKEFLDALY